MNTNELFTLTVSKNLALGLSVLMIFMFMMSCGSRHKPETHTVVIKGLKFLPSEITVRKGDTIKWINKDLVIHDVTEEVGKSWTSGPMENEAVWKKAITMNTDYFCSLHVVMKGKIKIE